MSRTPSWLAGTIEMVRPSPDVARRIPRSSPPRMPVGSPAEEYTSVPLAVQIRTVVVSRSRMRLPTMRWRPAASSSDMGSRTSVEVSAGARCFLTMAAAALFALFTPVSTPDDFRNQAPTARLADKTATPTQRTGRPTESCFLNTFPPRRRLERPLLLDTSSFGRAERRPERICGGCCPAPSGGQPVLAGQRFRAHPDQGLEVRRRPFHASGYQRR